MIIVIPYLGKNIYNESLTEEDLTNLEELHSYSTELENTLNQLSEDLNSGRFEWGELTKKGDSSNLHNK